MDPIEKAHAFESKLEEYYLYLGSKRWGMPIRHEFFAEWPVAKFSIVKLAAAIQSKLSEDVFRQVVDKLIDVKMNYIFLKSLHEVFYLGPYKIINNNALHELNPASVSGMRETQSRVFLLSAIVEEILDLLQLLLFGKISDYPKNKWGRILGKVRTRTGEGLILEAEAEAMLEFKDSFRTSELHKFSMVRALTSKPKWNHLQAEEDQIKTILARVFDYFHSPSWHPETGG